MRCVVTGGAGFIGSHLAEILSSNVQNEVIVIDNLSTGNLDNISSFQDRVLFVRADISDPKSGWKEVLRPGDYVFHLAALADIVPSVKHPETYFRSNVDGTFEMVRACQQVGVSKFIYAASSSCYGIPDAYPTSEDAEIRCEYPYALTKRLGEEILLHFAKIYSFPAISLRLFNVYGPRSRTSGTYGAMFGVFLAQKLAGKPLTVVGDGTQSRDFVFVTDVARAFIAAAHSKKSGEIYNVGTGCPVTVNRIVELLQAQKVHIPKRPGEPDKTHADARKILQDLNWKSSISIEEGVAKLLGQIDYWKKAPVWNPESIAEATQDWFTYLGRGA